MNGKKIAFIVCTNNEFYMNTCREYIESLNIPEGYEVEILEIHEAKSMASGYNEGREATDAKYKVYLHQDVFILYKDFLNSVLEIFEADENIGVIGMVGAPKMPPGGVMWYGHREGQLYLANECEMPWAEYRYELSHGLHDVQAVDGLLIVTSKDIPWREDLFDAWDFYDVSQSFEYLRAGYKVVVPEQKNPWVMHYDGMLNLINYDYYRKVALQEYKDILNEEKGGKETVHQENEDLRQAVSELVKVQDAILKYLEENGETLIRLRMEVAQLNSKINNLKYELLDPKYDVPSLFFPKIDSSEALIDRILTEGVSLARFGDAEFAIMDNIVRHNYQRTDERLAKRLREVIQTKDEKIIIAIANNYGNLDAYTEQGANGIRNYMTEETRQQHQKYLSRERVYYDAYVTRPYVMYADKENAGARFRNVQKLWEGRDVIIIEGAQTRLGVGNDLFCNTKSIKRVLGPAASSFDRYDDILTGALACGEEGTLFLIAMGPTAGVLAYDLTMAGYQALDVGHIDLEYEWYLAGEGKRVAVTNKYNNEMPGGDKVSDEELPASYFEQIVCDCSK